LLNTPPLVLLGALQKLKSNHQKGSAKFTEHLNRLFTKEDSGFQPPQQQDDLLFKAGYEHIGHNCEECGRRELISRNPRKEQVVAHYGTIASGGIDVRNSEIRQQVNSDLGGVLCVETEAAGLEDGFPCLVIRGICDYADSHKNDKWEGYAAATSAAYTKELLTVIPICEEGNMHTVRQVVGAGNGPQMNDLSGQFRSEVGPQFNGVVFAGPVNIGHTPGSVVQKCKWLQFSRGSC
jgi:hypothetical protein